MAQDGDVSKSTDKGKGKAVDGDVSKAREAAKDKDGKPQLNGKKDEPIIGGMFDLGLAGLTRANNLQLPKSSAKRINSSRAS
jgi:hypothetical protein